MSGLLVARRGSLNPRRAVAGPSYAAEVLADSPIAYWRMEETSGSSVADSSVNSNTGTVFGANLNVPGLAATGSAVSFDGTDDYITADNNTLWDGLSDALTLEAWIRTSTPITQQVFSRDFSGVRMFQSGVNSSGFPFLFVRPGLSNFTVLAGATRVDDGGWHHIVFTWDGSTIRVYVDGTEDASTAHSAALPTGTALLRIGTLAASQWFDGTMDELAVYDTALPAARVLAHYNAGVA